MGDDDLGGGPGRPLAAARRSTSRWAALLALAALATACGGAGASAPATTAAPTSASSPADSASAGASAPPSSAVRASPAAPATTTSAPAPSPATRPATTAPAPVAADPGFGEVAFTITPAAGGPAAAFCALLAETAQQHARGLMGRRDLAGYDAMLFRFAADTTSGFYMRNVPVPLSIAWFSADGRFVSSADMAPCPDRDGCPTYEAAGPYRFAIEVLEGGLGRLGVGPGSVLAVGGACAR